MSRGMIGGDARQVNTMELSVCRRGKECVSQGPEISIRGDS